MSLTKKKIMLIGLSGYAGVGKDEVRNILCNYHEFQGVAFADKLRAMALHLDPFFPQAGETYSQILLRMGSYEAAKRQYPFIRQYLIKLGHGARTYITSTIWLDALLPSSGFTSTTNLVVSDVRYANEAERIQLLGGVILRINRPGITAVDPTEEESLAKVSYDMTIENDGTLDDLKFKVRHIMGDIQLYYY